MADLRARGCDLRLAFEDDPSNHAMYMPGRHPLRLHALGLLRVGGGRRGCARIGAPTPTARATGGEQEHRQITPVVIEGEAAAQRDGAVNTAVGPRTERCSHPAPLS